MFSQYTTPEALDTAYIAALEAENTAFSRQPRDRRDRESRVAANHAHNARLDEISAAYYAQREIITGKTWQEENDAAFPPLTQYDMEMSDD